MKGKTFLLIEFTSVFVVVYCIKFCSCIQGTRSGTLQGELKASCSQVEKMNAKPLHVLTSNLKGPLLILRGRYLTALKASAILDLYKGSIEGLSLRLY